MQIKIYFGEAAIVIQDDDLLPFFPGQEPKKFKDIIEPSKKELKQLLAGFNADMKENYCFKVKDAQIFFKLFSGFFTSIEAAGGVVQNEEKDVLFIHRLGKWDLPKGKIETGESPELAAEREITEETGINALEITESICKTYHLYDAFGKRFLKTTYWFHFFTSSTQKPIAQSEENITEVKWIPTLEIKKPVADTYQNIKDVLSSYFDKP